MAGEAGAPLSAIVTVGAAFAGATCAQVLSHLFTIRRENLLRWQASQRYIDHTKFDYVLAVSSLERLLSRATLIADADEFDWRSTAGTYKLDHSDLLGTLDYDLNVNPQFMFNARRWFAAYHQETERFSTPEAIRATRIQLNFLAQTLRLYLWGLTEVVNADRRRAKPRHFGKIAYVDGTASYEEVAAVYKKIGYPLPDRSIFDLSTKLLERFDQLAAKNRPSKQ